MNVTLCEFSLKLWPNKRKLGALQKRFQRFSLPTNGAAPPRASQTHQPRNTTQHLSCAVHRRTFCNGGKNTPLVVSAVSASAAIRQSSHLSSTTALTSKSLPNRIHIALGYCNLLLVKEKPGHVGIMFCQFHAKRHLPTNCKI